MKAVDEILAFIRRHGPALIAHLLFLIWIWFFVIDPRAVQKESVIWMRMWKGLDDFLKGIGVSAERWYVGLAFLVTYLTAFEWVQGAITNLPGLRVRYAWRYRPDLLATACRTLQMTPDYYAVAEALDTRIRRAEENVRQSGQRHPYQWLIDRETILSRYRGAALVGVVALVVWVFSGAADARSTNRIWVSAILLFTISLALRWTIRRLNADRRYRTGSWALVEYRRAQAETPADPLADSRMSAMWDRALMQEAYARNPGAWLMRWSMALPGGLRDRVRKLFVAPNPDQDRQMWHLRSSQMMRYRDETTRPPTELGVEAWAPRFTSLLECTGAGLFMLVPGGLGLAPAADGHGQIYSFARRVHGRDDVAIELTLWKGFDEPQARPRLRALVGRGAGYLVPLGERAIDRLAQHDFPNERGAQPVRQRALSDQNWIALGKDGSVTLEDGVTVATEVELKPGHSVLFCVRTERNIAVEIVLQCFRVATEDKLLVAWRLLTVSRDKAPDTILPWWKSAAWRRLPA